MLAPDLTSLFQEANLIANIRLLLRGVEMAVLQEAGGNARGRFFILGNRLGSLQTG